MNLFDLCVIVASDERQQTSFEELLEKRTGRGLYPREIDFKIITDPGKAPIGSGGSVLYSLQAHEDLFERYNRVLYINAGGMSRRLPMYAAEGKIFAPMPVESSSLVPPVMLDLQLSLYLRYPWDEKELVVVSGDVVIDFNTYAVPKKKGEVCGFGKPEPYEIGAHHGVFKFDKNKSNVIDFYQKEPSGFLRENAAVEGTDTCAVDIGIVALSAEGMERFRRLGKKLYEHVDWKLYGGPEAARQGDRERKPVSAASPSPYVDLYLEIMTAAVKGITYEEFKRKVGPRTRLDGKALQILYAGLEDAGLKGMLVDRGVFLHFGALKEYPGSGMECVRQGLVPFYNYAEGEIRPDIRGNVLVCNSAGIELGPRGTGSGPSLIENCTDCTFETLEGNNMLYGLRGRNFSFPLPPDICVEEFEPDIGSDANLKSSIGGSTDDGTGIGTGRGEYLLTYGAADSWKPVGTIEELRFCGRPFTTWLSERSLSAEDVGLHGPPFDLYALELFISGGDERRLQAYWDAGAVTSEWIAWFKKSKKKSLTKILSAADPARREAQRQRVRKKVLEEQLLSGKGWTSIPEHDFAQVIRDFSPGQREALEKQCLNTEDDLLRIYRNHALSRVDDNHARQDSIESLKLQYLTASEQTVRLRNGVLDDQIVWARSPVRVDLAGGWSDTPPGTLRCGGRVVNVALNLNGQPPIQVFCRPTRERRVVFHSIDLGITESCTGFRELENYKEPSAPFSLPKAALSLLGLTQKTSGGKTLEETLEEVGSGLELTLLCALPKGSGLGTSSILGGTILAALERFFGLRIDKQELFRQVLQMEQMLTTGGGWQDQIGGLEGGVKYIASPPGLLPDLMVYQLDPYLFTDYSYSSCFTLYYTGIARLAKNILQEVVDNQNSFSPAYLFTLDHIADLADKAREAIALRDYKRVCEIIGLSWEANKRIHPSATNPEIEELLKEVKDCYVSMKLLGAGGGGFGIFASKDRKQAEELRSRLSTRRHSSARIVDMALSTTGLEVTVS